MVLELESSFRWQPVVTLKHRIHTYIPANTSSIQEVSSRFNFVNQLRLSWIIEVRLRRRSAKSE